MKENIIKTYSNKYLMFKDFPKEHSYSIRNIFIKLQEEFTELLDKMIMSDESNSMQRLQECNEVLQERKKEILK